MRKLEYELNLTHLKKIKQDIVPTLFTEHQFSLIEKRARSKRMTASERNEFSRSISKKMRAINKIVGKENVFIYGKEKIVSSRLKLAIRYLQKLSRKFKNKHIFISGSFLYEKNYHDIDVFVVETYAKEDYQERKFHINYLLGSVYHSLFFAGVKKLCVSNREMNNFSIKEKINTDTFISLYQELFNDLDRNFKGRATLREFLMQAAYLGRKSIPDSQELKQQVNSISKIKKSKEIIKKIFVETLAMGINPRQAVKSMNEIIFSYKEIIKEYPQHKNYYLDLMSSFQEVIEIAS